MPSGVSVLLLAMLDVAEGVATKDSVVFPAEDSALSVASGDSVVLCATLDNAESKEEVTNDDSFLLVTLDACVPVTPSGLSNAVLGGLLAKNDVMTEDILLESDVVRAGGVLSMLEFLRSEATLCATFDDAGSRVVLVVAGLCDDNLWAEAEILTTVV